MTKSQIREAIDKENGKGYSLNLNLNGYVFTKNNSFIIFEFKILEDIKICHIKYIHYENKKDFTTILVNCCNFWMGNKVEFIFYKEKMRDMNSAVEYLKELNFRSNILENNNYKYQFTCNKCGSTKCSCNIFNLYK